jgi:hypothetical protein
MKRIIRLTESDLARIVKRVINEETGTSPTPTIAVNTSTPVSQILGYKSSLITNVTIDTASGGQNGVYVVGFYYTDKAKKWFNYDNFTDSPDLSVAMSWGKFNGKDYTGPASCAEVATVLATPTVDLNYYGFVAGSGDGNYSYNAKKPYSVPAGGKYKNTKGQMVTWGKPGQTMGSEMQTVICSILGLK